MKLFVFMDMDGQTIHVGQLFVEHRRGRLTSAFAYDNEYLSRRYAYPIDPALPLGDGTLLVDGFPRAFLDASPHHWGRSLIDRTAGIPSRELDELDYLLAAADALRQGALRFSLSETGVFEGAGVVPMLDQLPVLAAAVRQLSVDPDEAATILFDMGAASLGGFRPKASVLDEQRLMVAKFAWPYDRWNNQTWEATALDVAEIAGVEIPPHRLVDVDDTSVLLVDRFDRTDSCRIGYISAATLCQAEPGLQLDYLDVAERLATVPDEDLRQLWRRIVFGIAINNTDDHLYNLGFLRTHSGWRLSPGFDLNPDPRLSAPHATPIGGEVTAIPAARTAMACVASFALSTSEARQIVSEVADAVRQWVTIAVRNSASEEELALFGPVFAQGLAVLDSMMR